MHPPNRVLVPIDLKSFSWATIEMAVWLARQTGAITDLLCVLSSSNSGLSQNRAHEEMLFILATLGERFSTLGDDESQDGRAHAPTFVGNLQPGDPVECILEFADRTDSDVIVIGANDHASLSWSSIGWSAIGSVAPEVVRRATRPVLVVPRVGPSALSEAHMAV